MDNIHEFIHVSEKISRDVLALYSTRFLMTVNWKNPEDDSVSLTMDKGFN